MTVLRVREPKRRGLGRGLQVLALLSLPLGLWAYFADYCLDHVVTCSRVAKQPAQCLHHITSRWHAPRESSLPGQFAQWTNKRTVTRDSKGNESVHYAAEVMIDGDATTVTTGTDAALDFSELNAWLVQEQAGEKMLVLRPATLLPLSISLMICVFTLLGAFAVRSEYADLEIDPKLRTFSCVWNPALSRKRVAEVSLDDMVDFHFVDGPRLKKQISTDVMIERHDGSKERLLTLPAYNWRYLASRSRPLRAALNAFREGA